VGRTHNGAQIVRIFDAVQDHDELSIRGYLVKFRILGCRTKGHDALMGVVTGEAAERSTFFKSHGNVGVARQVHDFLDAGAACASCDHNAVESAAGFESFDNGMKTYQNSQGDWPLC
jgi:hypothetical protein